MKKSRARMRPKGVIVVGILTSLGAAGNFFFTMMFIALMSVGGPPPSGYAGPSVYWRILVAIPLLLSILSICVSMGLYSGVKLSWYLSLVLWVSSATYYSFIAYVALPPNLKLAVLVFAVFVNAAFIIYFQSKPVRNFFLQSRNE